MLYLWSSLVLWIKVVARDNLTKKTRRQIVPNEKVLRTNLAEPGTEHSKEGCMEENIDLKMAIVSYFSIW